MRPRHVPAGAALAVAVAVLALVPVAQAARQDPSTLPEGVADVANTAIRGGSDFQVDVGLDAEPDSVVVTVCHFTSMAASGPDLCYMALGAHRQDDGTYRADTAAAEHPAWRDGWVVGYKVTVETAGGELHAPTSGDYYRIRVGQDSDPAPVGSAVVEDTPQGDAQAPDAPAAAQPSGHQAPLPTGTGLLALGAALLGAAARRR